MHTFVLVLLLPLQPWWRLQEELEEEIVWNLLHSLDGDLIGLFGAIWGVWYWW